MLALCVNRGGYRVGSRVAQFIFEWELCVRSVKHEVSVEEFGAWWKVDRATAYRRLAEFRELFPQLGERGKPSDLMGPLLERLARGEQLEDVDTDLVVPAA